MHDLKHISVAVSFILSPC